MNEDWVQVEHKSMYGGAPPHAVPVPMNAVPVPMTDVPGALPPPRPRSTTMMVRAKLSCDAKDEFKFEEKPKVTLHRDRKEKKLYDNLSDLYSIILATEHMEKAYVRDSITNDEYTAACKKLIAQYKTQREALGDQVPDIYVFMGEYNMDCAAAANRFKIGVPATIYHGGNLTGEEKKAELSVFHCVQHFITTMDSLKLDMKAVDELHPCMSDLMESLNKVTTLPAGHVSLEKVKHWLVTLNGMRASDELSDDQVRQMLMDLDQAYNAFHKFVEGKV